MNALHIEKYVNKIKDLLKIQDFDIINTGLELARSLDEAKVNGKLLEGCYLDKEGKSINKIIFA